MSRITPGVYTVIASEMSPYSVKVRSFLRYKQLPYAWVPRREVSDEAFAAVARLPIVPTVVTPEGEALQDSTPIIEALDRLRPEPGIHPPSAALAFLSRLFEEFGDEWGNKVMFHSRWWHAVDRQAAAQTIARLRKPRADADELARLKAEALERMIGRGRFVGSSAETAALLDRYYVELVDLLEAHLTDRKYLFGARPSFGDFGLAPELYEAAFDPTGGAILRAQGTHVIDWALRMSEPRFEGEFEPWEALQPTLKPLLDYIGRYFLPWSTANAEALAAGEPSFTVLLAGEPYSQEPQRYHAKSLKALRAAYAPVASDERLSQILRETGCLQYLT